MLRVKILANGDAPHIIMLDIDNRITRCIIDSGSAVTLIKQGIVQRQDVDPYGACDLYLTGVTGHELRVHGTINIRIGPIGSTRRSTWQAVVCDDFVLGRNECLIGRDLLTEFSVGLSFGVAASFNAWGVSIPMYTPEELRDRYKLKIVKGGSPGSRKPPVTALRRQDVHWRKWLDTVRAVCGRKTGNNQPVENTSRTRPVRRKKRRATKKISKEGTRKVETVSRPEEVIEIDDSPGLEPRVTVNQPRGVESNDKSCCGPPLEVQVRIEEHGELSEDEDEGFNYFGPGSTIKSREFPRDRRTQESEKTNEVAVLPTTRVENSETGSEEVEMSDSPPTRTTRQRECEAVVMLEDLVVPARTQMHIFARTKKRLNCDVMVIEPIEVGIAQVHIACTLATNGDEIPVRIINLSKKDARLQKGQKIGIAIRAEEENKVITNQDQSTQVNKIDLTTDQWLNEGFDLQHLSDKNKQSLRAVIRKYGNLFTDGEGVLTSTTKVKHHIILEPGAVPICKAPYRVPYQQRKILQDEIDRLLKAGVIRPSFSPWSAPVVLITKKLASGEEKVRMCIDYRGLNAVTKREYYPLPNITDLIQGYKSGDQVWFSVIDVAEAYHQIDMEESDIPLTGFSTFQGHYEYLKMPFGLCNAPRTFQNFINLTLSGLTGESCMVYLDDIIVFSSQGVEDHLKKLEEVFARLDEVNIKLKPAKCNFMMKKVKYLGHIITQQGVQPDPSTLESIRNFPLFRNVKGVRAFMGLVNWYRRFIPNMAQISACIVHLTKKDVPFKITEEILEAFEKLKNALTSEAILIYPDLTQPFVLSTDASGLGVGAVLSQVRDGYEKPIAYASRKFKKAEINYSTTEKELLGVMFGIQQFRCYLYGPTQFTIVTDHRPLKWILQLKDASSRLTRWALSLAEYNFSIVHRPGRLHGNADALSRMYCREDNFIDMEYGDFERYISEHSLPSNVLITKSYSITTAPEDRALAVCVSRDFNMTHGFSKYVRETYGHVAEMKAQENLLGDVNVLTLAERNIYYLILRSESYPTPTYQLVWRILNDLKQFCDQNNDRTVAFDKTDWVDTGLEWKKITEILNFVFFGAACKVEIYEGKIKTVPVSTIQEGPPLIPEWDRETIRNLQRQDLFCKQVIRRLHEEEEDVIQQYFLDKDEILYKIDPMDKTDKLVVPNKLREKVLTDFHESPMAGHQGQQKTKMFIQTRFYWPGMKTDIIKFCTECEACNRRKTSPHYKKVPLQTFTAVGEPWQIAAMDIVGPLVTTNRGNKYILTYIDLFSKYVEAVPLEDIKATTVARAYVEKIIVRHGTPPKVAY